MKNNNIKNNIFESDIFFSSNSDGQEDNVPDYFENEENNNAIIKKLPEEEQDLEKLRKELREEEQRNMKIANKMLKSTLGAKGATVINSINMEDEEYKKMVSKSNIFSSVVVYDGHNKDYDSEAFEEKCNNINAYADMFNGVGNKIDAEVPIMELEEEHKEEEKKDIEHKTSARKKQESTIKLETKRLNRTNAKASNHYFFSRADLKEKKLGSKITYNGTTFQHTNEGIKYF